MNTYRLVAYRSVGFPASYQSFSALTVETVSAALSGAVVRELAPASPPWSGYVLELALNRPDHEQALNDIAGALLGLGWNVAEGIVQEWVTSEIDGLVLGAAAGGAAGSATKNAGTALLAAALCGFVGYLGGSLRHTAKATYQASRLNPFDGNWQLHRLPPQPAS